MNTYIQIIEDLEMGRNSAVQEALNLRQTLLDKHAAAIRQIEKLEAALKEYAKEVATEGGQALGSGNVMKITMVNTRFVNDNAAALNWMTNQQIDPSQYLTISAERTAKFLPPELISIKPSVRVSFK